MKNAEARKKEFEEREADKRRKKKEKREKKREREEERGGGSQPSRASQSCRRNGGQVPSWREFGVRSEPRR